MDPLDLKNEYFEMFLINPNHAPPCSRFVLRIEWILTFHMSRHFQRSGVRTISAHSLVLPFLFGIPVSVFLQNVCHIMEICTATLFPPQKQQSTTDTRHSPATGYTYNFRRYTPFLPTSTFSCLWRVKNRACIRHSGFHHPFITLRNGKDAGSAV